MGAGSIFLGVGKLGVWGRKSPAGSRDGTPVRVCGQNLQKLTTGCKNNSSTGRFAVTTITQKHFTTFQEGGKCPLLPMPAVPMRLVSDRSSLLLDF